MKFPWYKYKELPLLNKKQIRSVRNEANLVAETFLLKKRFQNLCEKEIVEKKLSWFKQMLNWFLAKLRK